MSPADPSSKATASAVAETADADDRYLVDADEPQANGDKGDDKKEEPKPDKLTDNLKTVFWAILIAMIARTFFFEPFSIPSSSMEPTLLVGDYLFVSKSPYGYSRHSFPFSAAPIDGRINGEMPTRGDVIVFKEPTQNRTDYIKRVIGLPGDKVAMIDGQLYLNGEEVPRQIDGTFTSRKSEFASETIYTRYIETLPGGKRHMIIEETDTGLYDNVTTRTVPEDHVFVMGDNRDNSRDSRYFESVPVENIVGRADVIFLSVDVPPSQNDNMFTSTLRTVKAVFTNLRTERSFEGIE
ncbi:MAG: hypothetical protein Alpg2KO_17800 [Alphaproteobacteria bacterium]